MKSTRSIISVGLIMGITLGAFIGCNVNKEITFEENVSEEESKEVKVSQSFVDIKVNDNEIFTPLFYNNDDILGVMTNKEGLSVINGYPIEGEANDKMYSLSSENILTETNESLIVNSIYSTGIKGKEGIYTNKEDEKIYYYNRLTGEDKEIPIEFKLDYDEKVRDITLFAQSVNGNSDYYFVMLGAIDNSKLEETNVYDIADVTIVLKDLKSSKEYILEDEPLAKEVVDIIYDKNTEKFYSITKNGYLYAMDLNDKDIALENTDKIDLKGLLYLTEDSVIINEKGELVICNMSRNKSKETMIVYNIETKETKTIENPISGDVFVEYYSPESNLIILNKISATSNMKPEYYIGEVKNGIIEIYDRILYEIEDNQIIECAPVLINDNNTEILLTFAVSNKISDSQEFSHYLYKRVSIERE